MNAKDHLVKAEKAGSFLVGCDRLPEKEIERIREERARAKRNRFFAIRELAGLQREVGGFLRVANKDQARTSVVLKQKAQVVLWETLIQLLKRCVTCREVVDLLELARTTEDRSSAELWSMSHELKKFI